MAHTSEQASKESGPNGASTGTVGSTNTPAVSADVRTSSQHNTATATSSSQHPEHEDKEYDPSAEALIDDIDDERTLEEEEAMAGDNSAAVQNELDDLKRESEMPIEELLAYYQRMREQEGAKESGDANVDEESVEDEEDGDDEEEEEDEDEEDEGMEDECQDEVRKEHAGVISVKNGGLSARQPQRQHSTTGDQSNQKLLSPTTTAPQAAQVNPPLSNTHLLSPPKPSQINSQQQNPSELKDDSVQDTQTSAVDSDGLQRTQQSNLARPLQINQDQQQSNTHLLAVQNQNIDIECMDDNREIFRDGNQAQSNAQSATRHRRSMTEFLVDSSHASSNILKAFLDYDLDDSDDFDEDYSYTEDENADDERDWRRAIHVGPDYQAEVPESLSEYENNLPPYENQDTLVWRCNPAQTKEDLMEYLKHASAIPRRNDISISPASVPKISVQNMRLYREKLQDIHGIKDTRSGGPNHENLDNPPENLRDVYMSQSRKRLRIDNELEQENAMDGMNQLYGDTVALDHAFSSNREENSDSTSQDNRAEVSTEEYFHSEEQLLFLLLQCNHDVEEALRRRRLDPFKYYIAEPMSLWSQDECLNFEHGLRNYGKNFSLIRAAKVPTRTRSEVVAFYYLWKKSERHDVYTTQYKLDRKRSLSHPGTTDYMDKFIEDNESALNASSTHTPTPTESTVEANQLPEIQHGSPLVPKCQDPRTHMTIGCLNVPHNISRSNDSLGGEINNEDALQTDQIYLDGNPAI